MKRSLLIGLVLGCVGCVALGQMPDVPRQTVTAMVGGGEITIEYGRPSLKGKAMDRLIGSVGKERMWRAGANRVTSFETTQDILVGGTKVPAGKYSLYVHLGGDNTGTWKSDPPTYSEKGMPTPAVTSPSLVLNSVVGQPLGETWADAPPELAKEPWPHFNYQEEIGDKEVARVPLKRERSSPTDTFTILLVDSGSGATLKLIWGEESWSTPVEAVTVR